MAQLTPGELAERRNKALREMDADIHGPRTHYDQLVAMLVPTHATFEEVDDPVKYLFNDSCRIIRIAAHSADQLSADVFFVFNKKTGKLETTFVQSPID